MLQKIIGFLPKTWGYVWRHKIISIVVLAVLCGGGYYAYSSFNQDSGETRYILSQVTKGTINTTISGSGQVEAAEEKTVKAQTSGEITYLSPSIKVGSSVSRGAYIASIDPSDAQDAVSDAEDALETAQIALDDLIGSDESNPKVKKEAEDDLVKSYEDGYNTVSSVFLDLPSVMKNLDNILHENTFNNYQKNVDYYTYAAYTYDEAATTYKNLAEASYNTARTAYDENFKEYKASSIYSETEEIDSLISKSYSTTKLIAQAIKDTINLIQFYEDTLTNHSIDTDNTADTHISSLSSYLGTVNSDISSLFNIKSTISNNIDAVSNSTNEIRTAKLSVKSKEQALANAKETLANCSIYANMSGVISAVNISQGDDVSSGTNIITIITTSKIAAITLSETDIANVKVGDKASLTFDAVENLTVEGNVSEVDVAGSASSGVVSYGLEIAFDTDNKSIKSGMSTSVTITTNSKENVLILPTSAVKSGNNDTYYVQVLSDTYDMTDRSVSIKGVTSSTLPTRKIVTIGLSDDNNTEITSGLKEGDQVVLRVSSSTTSSSTSSSSARNSSSNSSIRVLNAGGPPGM